MSNYILTNIRIKILCTNMMHSLELYGLRTVRESVTMNCRTKPYGMANRCCNPCHRKKEKENQKNSSNSFDKYLPQFFFS